MPIVPVHMVGVPLVASDEMLLPKDLPSRIFLSPHPDDIAYSCYASLVNPPAPRKDATVILTVFSSSIRANGELGQRRSRDEISRVRQAEDEKFAAMERCRPIALGFGDSSIRGESNLGPDIALEDATQHPMFDRVKSSIAKVISTAVGYASIYIPLGVGNHIDHRMVRDAVRMLAVESGISGALEGLRYYEDLPYAAFTEEHDIRMLAKKIIFPKPTSYNVRLENFVVRKQRAVRVYASQLSPVVLQAFWDYSAAISNGEFPGEERVWVSDSSAITAAIDVVALVTPEASSRTGDLTHLLSNCFANSHYQSSIRRTIIMGPLYTNVVQPRNGVSEDVQAVASTLGCHILYPPDISNGAQLPRQVKIVMHDIQARYGIHAFYLRDREQEHQVDRILFDLTPVLAQRSSLGLYLQDFIQSLKQRMNVSVDIDVRNYFNSLKEWTGTTDIDRTYSADLPRRRWNFDQTAYDSGTREAVLGLLLAIPATDCLQGTVALDEKAVFIATDIVSLPTGFRIKMLNSPRVGKSIKTLLYCTDVAPVRSLVHGVVAPRVPSLNSVGGFDWEGSIRSLLSLSFKYAPVYENGVSAPKRYIWQIEYLQHVTNQIGMRMMQSASRLDSVMAASQNLRDELVIMNKSFALAGHIPVVTPGVNVIPCSLEQKEQNRNVLIHYARLMWGFKDVTPENTVIAVQYATSARPGTLLRTFSLLRAVAARMNDNGHGSKVILFIVVSSWDTGRPLDPEQSEINELLRRAGSVSASFAYLRLRIVNQPQWPLLPEHDMRPIDLSREDVHRATDIVPCLDTYNPFAMSFLEPIGAGAIAIMSKGCGNYNAARWLDATDQHVVLMDYSEDWMATIDSECEGDMDLITEAIFNVSLEDRLFNEHQTILEAIPRILNRIPWTRSLRSAKIASGRSLVAQLAWEDQFCLPFVKFLRALHEIKQ